MFTKRQVRRGTKVALFLGLSLPLLFLFYNWGMFITGGEHVLTVNPIEYTNRFLGDWALRFLLLSLAITPMARIFRMKQLVAYRRMIGVYAFFYVVFHFSSYVVLDHFFDWQTIWNDILKRNYITIGIIAFLLLIPLAVTSTKKMTKRLGGRNWKRLHRLIYIIAPLGAFHYQMMAKGNQLDPKIYIGIVVFLLGIRVVFWISDKRKAAQQKQAA